MLHTISKTDHFLFKLIAFIKKKSREFFLKSFILVNNLPYLFIFYYDIYEKALNSCVYKEE